MESEQFQAISKMLRGLQSVEIVNKDGVQASFTADTPGVIIQFFPEEDESKMKIFVDGATPW